MLSFVACSEPTQNASTNDRLLWPIKRRVLGTLLVALITFGVLFGAWGAQKDSKNVAVVHCSNGKQVTGTVIAAYMAFCQLTSAAAAVRLFHLKRMFNGKAVISPSQLR